MFSVLDRLRSALIVAGIPFEERHHAPVFTSEEAAAIRGVSLSSGAKALLIKTGEQFVLLIIPADRKLDSKRAKKSLQIKDLRFATADELMDKTGLKPGAVPPFGSLFGLPTYVDPALALQRQINFNAGDHGVSFSMNWEDYQRFESFQLVPLTQNAHEKTAGSTGGN